MNHLSLSTSATTSNMTTCRFWLEGACKNGSKCRFAHQYIKNTINTNSNDSPSNKIVCRYWNLGYCRRGITCHFLHPGSGKLLIYQAIFFEKSIDIYYYATTERCSAPPKSLPAPYPIKWLQIPNYLPQTKFNFNVSHPNQFYLISKQLCNVDEAKEEGEASEDEDNEFDQNFNEVVGFFEQNDVDNNDDDNNNINDDLALRLVGHEQDQDHKEHSCNDSDQSVKDINIKEEEEGSLANEGESDSDISESRVEADPDSDNNNELLTEDELQSHSLTNGRLDIEPYERVIEVSETSSDSEEYEHSLSNITISDSEVYHPFDAFNGNLKSHKVASKVEEMDVDEETEGEQENNPDDTCEIELDDDQFEEYE
ncbi:10762_t:CDS:1 [Ambispora leptoticha]|uniref:10762_t:CDS:1 n=1 Tax=Ambispora leptoticha TaxID=144679 RepID=A0A9N9FZI6_9GLOM|nr:10762_t:CDS:1 [Ambispora leptoticha]